MMTNRVLAVFLLTLLISFSACAEGTPSTSSPPATAPAPSSIQIPAPAPGPEPGVRFDRGPDVVSLYGEIAEINLSFTNGASELRTISPFPPEIKIIELPNLQPPDSVVRAFPGGKMNSRCSRVNHRLISSLGTRRMTAGSRCRQAGIVLRLRLPLAVVLPSECWCCLRKA